MDMPKGYQELTNSVLYDGNGETCGVDIKKFCFLMDIVREMAEALDDLTTETEHIETKNASQEFWEASSRAMKVYMKFKEWGTEQPLGKSDLGDA